MQKLYAILGAVLRFLGLQNVILIEAERIQRENTEAVFREMLRRGWNRHYRIVLVSFTPESIREWETKHVTAIKRASYEDSWTTKLRMRWLYLRACLILDENKQLTKRDPKTLHVFLTHGSPVKSTRGYYDRKADTDYALCHSEYWKPIISRESGLPADRRVILGQPRNDAFFNSSVSMPELFGKKYNKVVAWYPTFRQRVNRYCEQNTESAPIPIIHDEKAAKRINEIAAKYGVLLVVKPHPAQDLSRIKALDLDHLKVITDELFISHGIAPYEFLAKTDALITDYSSVIFDYLLTGNPIALAQEDYEEYEKKVGFAIDMELLRSCAAKLENAEDFEPFFRDLTEGNDPRREQREALTRLTNQYVDGNSTKRVVDWLESLLRMR